MPVMKDLRGMRVGRLLVIEPTSLRKNGRVIWKCKCDCGNEAFVRSSSLLKPQSTKSCGCYERDSRFERGTHKMTNSSEYRSWCKMKARCYNPRDKRFKNYGARGILVCERWRGSFQTFYDDMGPKPAHYSLERIDNDGNYAPQNCKWIPMAEQAKNRTTVYEISFGGHTLSISGWARKLGISPSCLRFRLVNLNWPVEHALTFPASQGNNQMLRFTTSLPKERSRLKFCCKSSQNQEAPNQQKVAPQDKARPPASK